MVYYVYLLKTLDSFKKKTYVGYTNDINSRLEKHNSNRGAKSTKGYKWRLIYKKRFYSKTKALSYEYNLKKNRKIRLQLIYEFEKKNNIHNTSL
jgi:putative endonuclease